MDSSLPHSSLHFLIFLFTGSVLINSIYVLGMNIIVKDDVKHGKVDVNKREVVKHKPTMEYRTEEDHHMIINNTSNNSESHQNISSNLMLLFPSQTLVTQGDKLTQEEWGGNCTLANWDKCKVVKTWFGWYLDKVENEMKWKHLELDCVLEPVLCMKNGWTVNRCHILCMGRCNPGKRNIIIN